MSNGDGREGRRRWYNGRGNNMIPLTMAIAVGSSLITATAAYYGHQAHLEQRIAEVREQYVRKDELRDRVEKPLGDLDSRQRRMEGEQIRQGQQLDDIRRILERNGTTPSSARPRREPAVEPR